MLENGLNQNYYDDYHYQGVDLGLMLGRLKSMRMPRGEFADIGWKEKINMLVLGSATSENLSKIGQIDSFLRPGKVEQDRAVIIDLNMYPLAKHKRKVLSFERKDGWSNRPKSTPEFPLPKFELVQADMRKLPFAENSFDLVLSDYTLNFLDNFADVDKTFEEMARILRPNGIALVSVRGNEKYPHGKNIPADAKNELQVLTLGKTRVNCFPLSAYLDCAERHGFDSAASDTVGTDICAVLRKSRKSLFI